MFCISAGRKKSEEEMWHPLSYEESMSFLRDSLSEPVYLYNIHVSLSFTKNKHLIIYAH